MFLCFNVKKILSTEANTSIVQIKFLAEVGTVCPYEIGWLESLKRRLTAYYQREPKKARAIFVSIVIIEEPDPQLYEFLFILNKPTSPF
jgi:hypothetical protein